MECQPSPECKYFRRGCYEDTHHLAFPRRDYTTPLEKRYRELPENKEEMCRAEHDRLHATEPTPHKPTIEAMKAAVEFYKNGQA